MEIRALERRMVLCRLAVWAAALGLAWFVFRADYPSAYLAAAFGLLFTLLWPLAYRAPRPTQAAASCSPDIEPVEPTPASAVNRLPHLIDVGMDGIVLMLLLFASGGFGSPFAPLLLFPPLEAYLLLGVVPATRTALILLLLSVAHLRAKPVSAESAALYGVTLGTLLATALLLRWKQTVSPDAVETDGSVNRSPAARDLEQLLREADRAHTQLKRSYQEITQLNRKQRAQIERLRAAEQLFEAGASTPTPDGEAAEAYAALLRIVTDALEAGGGALWLRCPDHDSLVIRAAEGRGAAGLRGESVPNVAAASPAHLRTLCEARLLAVQPFADAAVASPWLPPGPESAEAEPRITNAVIHPVSVVLLREPTRDGAVVGDILGAVGISEPRGAARFSAQDVDRLVTLAAPLAAALTNVELRRKSQRRLRELSLLYDLSRLAQNAADMEQVYKVIVSQVQQVVPYENCTLFLLDTTRSRLEPKATRGRVVNLLDSYLFEKGQGVSGWVASKGKPLVISDLTRERNLLHIETLPPRIRSFIALPLKVRNIVVGVLQISHSQPNAFSADDHQMLTLLAGQAAATIERSEAIHTLETLAITDGLTNTYNHRYFLMRFDDEMRRCKRYHLTLSVMLLDLDYFKQVNDRHGHPSGDAILQQFAQLLQSSVRETETVARYGGEEFALLLPQTGLEQAGFAAERVRAAIEAHTFHSLDGQPIRLTASIGIAACPPHGRTRREMLEQADRALYTAKNAGRNCIRTASTAPLDVAADAPVQAVVPARALAEHSLL